MNILYDLLLHPTFIVVTGIITYVLFLLTLLGGLFRKQLAPKLKKAYLPLHRTFGIIAVILATFHIILMIAF